MTHIRKRLFSFSFVLAAALPAASGPPATPPSDAAAIAEALREFAHAETLSADAADGAAGVLQAHTRERDRARRIAETRAFLGDAAAATATLESAQNRRFREVVDLARRDAQRREWSRFISWLGAGARALGSHMKASARAKAADAAKPSSAQRPSAVSDGSPPDGLRVKHGIRRVVELCEGDTCKTLRLDLFEEHGLAPEAGPMRDLFDTLPSLRCNTGDGSCVPLEPTPRPLRSSFGDGRPATAPVPIPRASPAAVSAPSVRAPSALRLPPPAPAPVIEPQLEETVQVIRDIEDLADAVTLMGIGLDVATGPSGEAIPIAAAARLFAAQAQRRALQRQLTRHGARSLRKSRQSFAKRLDEHRAKLREIRRQGGYDSSVKREIRTFDRAIRTIDELLRK